MALGFQTRALERALSRMGERAFLRGASAGRVHLARNVALFAGIGDEANDNHMVRYIVATVLSQYAPRVGDSLEFVDANDVPIPGQAYVLDRLVVNNGHTCRFIVAEVPA